MVGHFMLDVTYWLHGNVMITSVRDQVIFKHIENDVNREVLTI